MESERRIIEAKKIIRRFLNRGIKRHSRVHVDALDDGRNKLRALDGLCGHCENILTEPHYRDGKETVRLKCEKGLSPLILYQSTPLDEEASCPEFKKVNNK